MRIVEYTPDRFESLRRAAEQMSPTISLRHRPFVDYYFTTRDWCKLYLFLSDDESVAATLGWERMRFEYEGRELILGIGSSFWSLQKGAGGYLLMQWLKDCPIGSTINGTAYTQHIVKNLKWIYFEGIHNFHLNEPRQRVAAKWLRHWLHRLVRVEVDFDGDRFRFHRLRSKKLESQPLIKVRMPWLFAWLTASTGGRTNVVALGERLARRLGANVLVREEHAYTEDLFPRTSPFTFRFAPDLDHLAWRYALNLSFVRYRLFRILVRGVSTGYVILNETPSRLMVAQCDANDPTTLVHGILLSLAEASRSDEQPREVFLTLCHRGMQASFQSFGFRRARVDWVFNMGTLRGGVDLSSDTSNWLVNYDWGDNGLLGPFLDEVDVRLPRGAEGRDARPDPGPGGGGRVRPGGAAPPGVPCVPAGDGLPTPP